MKTELTYETALHKAAALCSESEKCEYDVREKLKSWGISSDETDKIIARLISEKFLDEQRFTLFFVKDKFRFNKWGKIKIAYALKQKQIKSAAIQETMEVIDENDYETLLLELFQSKLKGLKYKDNYDKQAKLFRFAQSRGFEGQVISKIMKRFLKEDCEF